ncbi:hypothetical protein N7492_003792 [Penicillium capsulatum]|uniref:Zn(2)-C6 fungal-type domain-containing protein n=1 Tax=Penicillium capsulatum TaxID=69766 RepID=A0A9W9IMQ4_9EURO|nr:hypothetical protein N7492_003792 [Penicillium capsulatum]KAJ6121624.1 hypothetical protein N7512_004089 [Penicillium capsulatum]
MSVQRELGVLSPTEAARMLVASAFAVFLAHGQGCLDRVVSVGHWASPQAEHPDLLDSDDATGRMGGVPWQSKGCRTCKQRRIKCDLQQPECARCIKRGLPCPGYTKHLTFIHHASSALIQTRHQPLLHTARSDRVTVLPSLIRDGPQARSQLSSLLFHAYSPLDARRTSGVDAWLYLLSNFLALPTKSEMFERGVAALSCIYVGKMNQDHHLIRHGVQQYNWSIRLMHSLLRRDIRTPEVLYATVIFQVLEAIYCPNGLQVWIAHQDGMNALLRYYQPTTPCNLLVRAIYENQQKVHFMFSATATKRIGGASHPPVYSFEDGPLNELFNFFVNIVSVLEQFEELDRRDFRACQSALESCLATKNAMILWYEQRVDRFGGNPSVCAPGTRFCDALPSTDALFGPAYTFSSLDSAIMHLLYWTGMVLIQSLIYQTTSLVRFYGKGTRADPITNEEFTLTGLYADQICRAIPYCLQPSMRLGATHSAVATLSQVCKTYAHRRCRDQHLWCQRAYLHLANLGLDSARLLHDSIITYWEITADPYTNSILSLSLRLDVSRGLFQSSGDERARETEHPAAVQYYT